MGTAWTGASARERARSGTPRTRRSRRTRRPRRRRARRAAARARADGSGRRGPRGRRTGAGRRPRRGRRAPALGECVGVAGPHDGGVARAGAGGPRVAQAEAGAGLPVDLGGQAGEIAAAREVGPVLARERLARQPRGAGAEDLRVRRGRGGRGQADEREERGGRGGERRDRRPRGGSGGTRRPRRGWRRGRRARGATVHAAGDQRQAVLAGSDARGGDAHAAELAEEAIDAELREQLDERQVQRARQRRRAA